MSQSSMLANKPRKLSHWYLQLRYRNVIWNWKIHHAYDNKRNKETLEGIGLHKEESIRLTWRKIKLQICGNIRSRLQKANGNERKSKKSVPLKNQKTSPNQVLRQKSNQRNKYQDSLLCKILWTFLKLKKGGTLKSQDIEQGNCWRCKKSLHLSDDRQTDYVTGIEEVNVNAAIHRLKECINKNKEKWYKEKQVTEITGKLQS